MSLRPITISGLPVVLFLLWRYSIHHSLTSLHAMILFAFPIFLDERPQSPQYRKRAALYMPREIVAGGEVPLLIADYLKTINLLVSSW